MSMAVDKAFPSPQNSTGIYMEKVTEILVTIFTLKIESSPAFG